MAVIFNPSFPYRIAHTVVAFYITTGFAVVAVGSYLLLKQRAVAEARTMVSITLWLLSVLVPLQMFIGDQHGLNTLEHQPAKLAAIEAHWETGSRIPLILFAIPDDDAERNHFTIEIPYLGSLVLTHSLDGTVKGLKDFPPDQRPPVALPFFGFRVMVGIRILMLGMVVLSWWLRWRGTLFDSRFFQRASIAIAPLGFLAVLAGWTTTEVGRQPWVVYGQLRTADAVSPSLTGWDVLLSLTFYMIVYLIIFPAGAWIMARIISKGPAVRRTDEPIEAGRPSKPVTVELHAKEEHDGQRDQLRSHLDAHPRCRHLPLRAARRLRSRCRHPLRLRAGPAVAQSGHELDRTDLGRQRDLAGARRPRRCSPPSRWPSPSSSRRFISRCS